MSEFDILGLGCAAMDEVLIVDAYPEPDTKTRIRHRFRQCGGLTATALITAARFGGRCAYAATLGTDEPSQEILAILRAEGVSTEHTLRHDEGGAIRTTIIVDETNHTRTIFFDLSGTVGATEAHPPEELITSARLLYLDHYGIEGMTRAAKVARAHRIPTVADFERNEWPGFDTLLEMVDHVIINHAFGKKLTGLSDPRAMIDRLWNPQRQAVVITEGEQGCYYRGAETGNEIRHLPAFKVAVKDTTGCGDIFHGVYCWSLLNGEALAERVRVASAAAALKATRYGGQPAIPTPTEVETFLHLRM